MLQLGAKCIYPKGEGDDQHYLGYDGALDPWIEGLLDMIVVRFPLSCPMISDDVVYLFYFIIFNICFY